ncbi:DUF2089 family protein [Asticcacaulis solisilvae]|uniref:DUF2089 family protein n=1 Tax=Asticcacaulis solisilvae TaxID=1217274 RepID=UPI003FD6C1CA
MSDAKLPEWVKNLAAEDLSFIRSFLLTSGSLKAMAVEYGVSYPTIRARLDQVIERLRLAESERIDPFHARLKDLVAGGELEPRLARELLDLHRKEVAR